MPVRSAVPHILSDFRLEQLIYRIFLLSPFEIVQDQQLATTWRIRLYMCIMLLGYTVLRISFCLQFQNNDAYEYLSANGNLWMFANVFYLTLSSLTFTVVILNGFITGNDQIEYFQELFDVDMKLFTSFGINLKRSRWRLASNGLLVLGFVNNIRYFVISMTSNHTTILTPFQMFSFNFTCYFDYILSLFTAVFYVNCTQLCRERLASTSKLLQNYSNLSTEQMDTVLQLFVQIRRLTLLINRFMGVVVLLKIPHDFINGSFVVYVMCSSLYSSKELVDSVEILLWFVEAVIGPIVMTLTAEMLSREVKYIVLITELFMLLTICLLRRMNVLKYYPV